MLLSFVSLYLMDSAAWMLFKLQYCRHVGKCWIRSGFFIKPKPKAVTACVLFTILGSECSVWFHSFQSYFANCILLIYFAQDQKKDRSEWLSGVCFIFTSFINIKPFSWNAMNHSMTESVVFIHSWLFWAEWWSII